jgi:hypothetical protein
MGTFLMLTGFPISGKDAISLKIADTMIKMPKGHESEVEDIIKAMDPTSMLDSHQQRQAEDAANIHEHSQLLDHATYQQE